MKKIMLDPGHGGKDSGASANGMLEKNMNLEVANILKRMLDQKGFEVQMTRYQDTFVELSDRCRLSNAFNADLFISIHFNAGGGSGYEVYYFGDSPIGSALAEKIGAEFSKVQKKRYIGNKPMAGTKTWNYYVLKNTNAPSVLTEYLFIDNKEDLAKYDPNLQAKQIFDAICNYYKIASIEEAPKQVFFHNWELILKDKTDSPEKWIEFVRSMANHPLGKYLPDLIIKLNK